MVWGIHVRGDVPDVLFDREPTQEPAAASPLAPYRVLLPGDPRAAGGPSPRASSASHRLLQAGSPGEVVSSKRPLPPVQEELNKHCLTRLTAAAALLWSRWEYYWSSLLLTRHPSHLSDRAQAAGDPEPQCPGEQSQDSPPGKPLDDASRVRFRLCSLTRFLREPSCVRP